MTGAVDDHLGLLSRPLGDHRLIVFTGMSGSGKSTCIELLTRHHPAFAGRPHTTIGPAPIDWGTAARTPTTELVVVDELLRWVEIGHVARLVRRGHALLVASHLPSWWVRALGTRWSAAHFHTDRSAAKLHAWLSRRGIHYTPERVDEFARVYGANYTDLQIILERSHGDDFDTAFERFARTASIERTPSVGSAVMRRCARPSRTGAPPGSRR